ncbi:hypothetical protein LCGC14_0087450 [marine sediment metagenome]|uniref:N-acetyltransferase domain-containing protein n=1 Tax=marine sediment metagenome TaxID=412755 RepID=A0A0F9XY80_9ZZZZ|nr:GNAT family N-acetyltransferase [Halomonas sp.]HDZ46439.1 GNAT family N-acetyltransferase [Halomonas sp.]HEB06187.1 GNAT family N-acetyltransferase [Halomonas sp.]
MTHQHNANSLFAAPCPPAQRREALLQLAAAHDPEFQAVLSIALKKMSNAPEAAWDGLWVSYKAGQIMGAVWVQRLPMNMAQLWLPLPGVEAGHVDLLLRAAHQWVTTHNIRLCHVEVSPQTNPTEALLIAHGMQPLAHLDYLTGRSDQRLALNKHTPLSLQPFSLLSNAEQLALLAAVGQDSLDSSALRELLSVEELLAGFYQQDPQAPRHWYAIHYQQALVGVLLLAPREALGRWELLLMGLAPEWRGQGLGRALLNNALQLAQHEGIEEVMLAVDKLNLPAKQLYRQAGFECYAEQRLLAWTGNHQGR